MNNFISNAPYNSLFIIYLLISCNFLAQLFSCELQRMLTNSMYVKHFFGFTTMLFCIIFVDSSIQKESKYVEGLIYAIIFYLWFWATTKTNIYVTLIIVILFLIIYVLQIHKNTLDQDENKDNISQISKSQNILALVAFLITVVGFIHYYLLKSDEYGSKFNNKDFLVGTANCSNNSNINDFVPQIFKKLINQQNPQILQNSQILQKP